MLRAARHMGLQPLREQVFDLQRQAQQHITGRAGAMVGGGRQHRFHLMIVQGGNGGGEHHACRHTGIAEALDGLIADGTYLALLTKWKLADYGVEKATINAGQ